MDLDADMIPTSPSADSSPSSSDLDTEVTLHPRPSSWVFLDCLAYMYGLTCLLWMTSRFLVCVCVCVGWGRQSTGSFFPDRSTTLGTLMGVSAFGGRRAPAAGEGSAEGPQRAALGHGEEARGAGVWRRRRRRRRRGSWWRLCRDHGGPPTSLGEFLDMERQLAGADFLCDGSGAGASGRETAAALFENGRVRPPPQPAAAAAEERGRWRLLRASDGSSTSTATASASLARLPVLLTGICSGGAG